MAEEAAKIVEAQTKLKFLELESSKKAQLEEQQRELERTQMEFDKLHTVRDLEVAQTKYKVLSEFCEDDDDEGSSVVKSNKVELLEKYIDSQFKEVCETHEQKASSQTKTILVDPSSLGAIPKVSISNSVPQPHRVSQANSVHQPHRVSQANSVPQPHSVPQTNSVPQPHSVTQPHLLSSQPNRLYIKTKYLLIHKIKWWISQGMFVNRYH